MTKEYKSLEHIIRDIVEKKNDPCWDGYKQVGMKKKNGKEVPNCVPEETEIDRFFFEELDPLLTDEDYVEIAKSFKEDIFEEIFNENLILQEFNSRDLGYGGASQRTATAPNLDLPPIQPEPDLPATTQASRSRNAGGVSGEILDPDDPRGRSARDVSPDAGRRTMRQSLRRWATRAGARRAAASFTQLHPAVQAGLTALDAVNLVRAIRDGLTTTPTTQTSTQTTTAPTTQTSTQTTTAPATQTSTQTLPATQTSTQTLPATQTSTQTLPATQTSTQTLPATQTSTQTPLPGSGSGNNGRRRKRVKLNGISSPSSVTDSAAASASDYAKIHMHMADPYVARGVNEESDATAERSKIENVARPSARRDRVVKQQEIQKKIIDENRSLAATVKKNVEETRKRERNSSPIITNPKTNDPDPDGHPGGY